MRTWLAAVTRNADAVKRGRRESRVAAAIERKMEESRTPYRPCPSERVRALPEPDGSGRAYSVAYFKLGQDEPPFSNCRARFRRAR